jgi:hypothetical protein
MVSETRYKKFLMYIPTILSESTMDLQEIYDAIKNEFPSDCNDAEPCIHEGHFYQHGEWKHLVRAALEQLRKQLRVTYSRADRTYRLT